MAVLARPARSATWSTVLSVAAMLLQRRTCNAQLQALRRWEPTTTEQSGTTVLNMLPCLGTGASQAVLLHIALPSGEMHTVRVLIDVPKVAGHQSLLIFFAGASLGPEHYGWLNKLPLAVVRVPSVHDAHEHNRCTVADGLAVLQAVRELSVNDPRFPLFGRLKDTVLIGGHSFGGGAAIELAMHALAARAPVVGLIMLAASLMNTPWGNTARAASTIHVPSLVVSSEMDCTTGGPSAVDAASFLVPLLPAHRKAHVVLAGYGHEGWARRPCQNDSHFARSALDDNDSDYARKALDERGPCQIAAPRAEEDRPGLSVIGDSVGAEVVTAFIEYTQTLDNRTQLAEDVIERTAWARFARQMARGVSERRWWYTESAPAGAARAHAATGSACPCANNATFMAHLSDTQMRHIGQQHVASFDSTATSASEAQKAHALENAFWTSAGRRPRGSCDVDAAVYPSSVQAECASERFRFCFPNFVCDQPNPFCFKSGSREMSGHR